MIMFSICDSESSSANCQPVLSTNERARACRIDTFDVSRAFDLSGKTEGFPHFTALFGSPCNSLLLATFPVWRVRVQKMCGMFKG